MHKWRWIVLLMLAAAVAGCTAAGAVMHAAFGPAPVDAKYVPPKEPAVVLVENYRNPSAGESDADQIARQVSDALKEHKAVPLINADKVVELRDQNVGAFHAMTIPEVGKAVGAKTVIYVDLFDSGVEQDASQGTAHASAIARVRVVDVKTGSTLWPVDSEDGYELSVDVPYGHQDDAALNLMRSKMLAQLSDSIARLFYQWKPDTEQESNEG